MLYKDNSGSSVLDRLQIVKFDNFQMQSSVNTCFERYSGHLGHKSRGEGLEDGMYPSETESLIFEVRDQDRNCFIIKTMCGLKHSKRPGLNEVGQIASGVWVWIFLTRGNNSDSGQTRKQCHILVFRVHGLDMGTR